MNLSQLASFICAKVNQSETDDVAACKEFLKRRMEMIWNDDLWKDSLVAFTQVLSPDDYAVTNTWLPEKGVLLCPTIIERVVAARLDSRKMNVQRQEFYYRFDYDSFAKTGNATEFVLLPPCVWEFDEIKELFLGWDEDGDVSTVITFDLLNSSDVDVTRRSYALSSSSQQVVSSERLDSITKAVTESFLYLQADSQLIVEIPASETSAPLRQRIRLLNIPETEVTIRVLGKKKMPTFTSDLDSPPIIGVTNCLLAFAQSDMLQRERQYGKSQAIAQEGMGLLEQLKRQEVVQQAHSIRIQPDTGMGGEYDFNSGGYSPLTF